MDCVKIDVCPPTRTNKAAADQNVILSSRHAYGIFWPLSESAPSKVVGLKYQQYWLVSLRLLLLITLDGRSDSATSARSMMRVIIICRWRFCTWYLPYPRWTCAASAVPYIEK
jgi:hypothetical protein